MYWAASINYPPYIHVEYLKSTLPSLSCDTASVTVGAFICGAIFGSVTVVLVVGIVFGVFKLRRNANNRNTKQERFVLFILTMRCRLHPLGVWQVMPHPPPTSPVFSPPLKPYKLHS